MSTHRNDGTHQVMMEDHQISQNEMNEHRDQRKDSLGDEIWGGVCYFYLLLNIFIFPFAPLYSSTNVPSKYSCEVAI